MDYVNKFINFFSKSPPNGGGDGAGGDAHESAGVGGGGSSSSGGGWSLLSKSGDLLSSEAHLSNMTIFILYGRKCVPSLPSPPYPMFVKQQQQQQGTSPTPPGQQRTTSARPATAPSSPSISTRRSRAPIAQPSTNEDGVDDDERQPSTTAPPSSPSSSPSLPPTANNTRSTPNALDTHKPVNWAGMSVSERTRLFVGSEARKFLWFSYRSDFPAIGGTSITTDSGWGCTLRTGQMMLANAFLLHFLGSEWLTLMESPKVIESTRKILKWFGDSRTAPYSIHAIATVGDKQFGKPIGDWHGPATIAHILSLLALQHQPDNNMIRLHVAQDGVLAKQAIYPSKATEKEAEDHVDDAGECDEDYATIILVPLRLGVDKLNHVYSSALLDLFALPEFLGFIGGRPSASYYFMGCQVPTQKHHLPHQSSSSAPSAQAEANSNNSTPANFAPQVLYLDPHTTQPFHNFHPDPQSVLVAAGTTGGRGGGGGNGAEAGFHSYRFPTVYRMPLSQIDPSLTLGFYTRNRAEFHNLCDKLEPIMKAESPLFVITEQMLSHNSTTNPDALDDDDMLNFDLGDDFDMNDC